MSSTVYREFNILVIEDELPLQDAIRIKLENNGLKVITARSVKQALSYVEEVATIDVIWLDHYLLGQENGLEFVARLKNEKSRYRDIPIFVVSNSVGQDKITSYINFGINKYYTKTEFTLAEIVTDIKEYVTSTTSESVPQT
jgi:CheY-like chemotaxis protein